MTRWQDAIPITIDSSPKRRRQKGGGRYETDFNDPKGLAMSSDLKDLSTQRPEDLLHDLQRRNEEDIEEFGDLPACGVDRDEQRRRWKDDYYYEVRHNPEEALAAIAETDALRLRQTIGLSDSAVPGKPTHDNADLAMEILKLPGLTLSASLGLEAIEHYLGQFLTGIWIGSELHDVPSEDTLCAMKNTLVAMYRRRQSLSAQFGDLEDD
jgi:hypothetical protein